MSRGRFKSDWAILKKSFVLIHQTQPWLMPVGLLASVVTAIGPFINIYMSAKLIDRLIYKNWDELIRLAILTVILNFGVSIIRDTLNQVKILQSSDFYNKQKQIMSNKIMDLDYESAESTATHEKMRRIDDMHEITGMRLETLVRTLCRITEQIVKVILAVSLTVECFMATNKEPVTAFEKIMNTPYMTIGFIATIGVLILVAIWIVLRLGEHLFRLYEEMLPFNKIQWYYDREYLDAYATGKEIRIFDQDEMINRQYDEALEGYNKICLEIGKVQGKFSGAGRICSLLSQGIIYLFVSLKALAGVFGAGGIVKYVGAIRQLYTGVKGIVIDLECTKQLLRWLRLYWDFMETENVNYKGTLPVEKRDDHQYEIEFKNVSFKYPGRENEVLKDLSLKFKIGEKLAVVGMNGSGKTTMIKLLCRLYDPTEGEITLNGINIKKYNLAEYMSLFSVVFQDFKLFSVTLGENVATKMDYDREEVKEALIKCGLEERINQLDKGMDTYLYNNFGETGIEISGGEAQKIALARALYKDAPFIVLDEPTAALDPIAEFEVYTKFNEIVGGKTAIYISHRLSSCRFCDDIVVFHEGRLVQRGSHDLLIVQTQGKYYELWNAQAQYYEQELA